MFCVEVGFSAAMKMRPTDCVRCVIAKSCGSLMTVKSRRAIGRRCCAIVTRRVMKTMTKSMIGVNRRCWFVRAPSTRCVSHCVNRCAIRRDHSILHPQIRRQTRILPIALHPNCQWNASLRVSPIDFQLNLIGRACFAWMLIDSMCVCLLIDLVA